MLLAVRDEERGLAAARSLVGPSEVAVVDMADLGSVRAFSDQLEACDVLINNAGIMGVPYALTVDGHESQMAVNHLGHFALTLRLLGAGKIRDRVVVLGSMAHRSADLRVDDLAYERHAYGPYRAYANSKLANLLFMAELQRRLTAEGSRLRAVAAHPGYTSTMLVANTSSKPFNALARVGNNTVGMSPRQGARVVVAAAVMDVPGNTFFGPGGPGQLSGEPVMVGRSRAASDPELARQLWAASEAAVGERWP